MIGGDGDPLKLDRAVREQIRMNVRRNSAQGQRRASEFKSFVREIKVRSKDDMRMEGLGRKVSFKCEFKVDAS